MTCGCESVIKAKATLDRDERAVWEADGKVTQARWRCPHAGFTPDVRRLDDACLAVREDVAAVVGCESEELGSSCPLAITKHAWLADVVKARRWAERGLLREYTGAVSSQLFEAIDTLDDAIATRDARDSEERTAEHAAKSQGANAPPVPYE